MEKILLIDQSIEDVEEFFIPYINFLKKQGYEVHCVISENKNIKNSDKTFYLQFSEKLFSIKNIKAYKKLKKLIYENNYKFIYSINLIGGTLARLATRKKCNTKVIYATNGLPFYNGDKIKNWLIYYPIEKYLCKFANIILTTNQEDYDFIEKRFKVQNLKKINGFGIICKNSTKKLSKQEIKKIYNHFDLNEKDYIFLSIGNLTENQNHIMQIDAVRRLIFKYKNIKLLIVGKGQLMGYLKFIIEKYELNNNIILTDELEYIPKLLNLTNVVLSTAKAEGISANLVKAMVQCKPIIATDVRGNKELLKQKNLVKNTDELIKKMSICINANKSKEIYETQKYEVENVLQEVFGLYT